MKKLITKKVIEMIKKNQNIYFEFFLNVGNISCTHFLIFQKGKIINTGIDSKDSFFTENEFADFYQGVNWSFVQKAT